MDAAEVPNEWAEAREASGTPHGKRATKDEVFAAIEALAHGELLKLKCFAAWRIRGLGRACCGRTWEDLLSEAKLSSLRGAASHLGRCWNRNVDLVTHLAGAMRSISSHWKRDFNEQEAVLESEIVACTEEKDDLTSPLKNAVSEYPSQEREVAARQEWDLIEIRCHDDPNATQVLEGFSRGMSATEIMRGYHLTKWDYQQAVKRIKRRLGNSGRGGEDSDGREKRC